MSQIDLLGFGPHPDDLEIGLGGTLAKHAAIGHSVGLCDLTRGEMSSNGTPEERVREAEAGGNGAWCGLAGESRAAGPRDWVRPDHVRRVVELIRRVRPRAIAIPYWQDRHPDHEAAGEAAPRRGVQREAPALRRRWRTVAAPLGLLLLHQRCRPGLVRGRRVGPLRHETAGAGLLHEPVHPRNRVRRNASKLSGFRQLIESRDAQFGALAGVRFAEGIFVSEPVVREHLLRR